MQNLQEHMLAYLDKGFSVIPIGLDKKPLVEWKEYQLRKSTKEEVENWCSTLNPAGIGLVTGKISGVAVLDIDLGADTDGLHLPPTPSVKTGGGGWHYYFQLPQNGLQSHNGFRHKMDLKAEGGYVIAPPSAHKSGKNYEWAVPLGDMDLAEMPDWLKKETGAKSAAKKDWDKITTGVGEGKRNDSAAAYIGKLLHGLPEEDWESVGWASLTAWNEQNTPPLPKEELRSIFDSIATREKRQKDETENNSHASKLIKSILSTDVLLFHDQHQDGYIALHGSGAEIIKLKSKQFKAWVAKISWEQFKKPIRSEDVRTVLGTLEGIALYNNKQCKLHVRTAEYDGAFWYDLGVAAVKITKEGWKVVDNPPIIFRRYPHQEQQVAPIRGGSISQILNFVNIKNKQEQLLIQVWCVAGIIPGFPHPFSVFHGPQGSAKSTSLSVFKRLLDPSQIQLSSPLGNMREFVQLGSHHWFLPIDNLSKIPEWLSDALCRACTGEGFSKRELYSDDDDIVYSFQNVGGINGVNLVVEKPDLMERSIIFALDKLERVENQAIFNRRFDEARPLILGAMFDAVAQALQTVDDISSVNKFRMSDFAKWGCAIAEAIGYSAADFISAYQTNIKLQHQEAVDASPVAQAIEVLMKAQGPEWNGTPTELHKLLEETAISEHIDMKAETWPKAANWIWRRIAPIATNLQERGIKVSRASGEERTISIVKTAEYAVDGVNADAEAENTGKFPDSIPDSSPEHAEEEISLEMLDLGQQDGIDSII